MDEVIIIRANDTAGTRRLLEENASEIACVVADPLISKMGFLELESEFLNMLREVTSRRGIVLIFDEVFSFRVGYNGAQGRFGVTPDLTALGKVIGGGLPIGAVGGRRDIMSVFTLKDGKVPVEHSGTFSGNPMTMAAGIATLRQLDHAAYAELDRMGDRAREGLRTALKEEGVDGRVKGMGSLLCVLFSSATYSDFRGFVRMLTDDNALAKAQGLHDFLLKNGVKNIAPSAFVLSLAMGDAEIDLLVARCRDYLRSIAR